MPISLTPYRPLPFTLDGSAPPGCTLLRGSTAMAWTDACHRLSEAFQALGHPLPDPLSEGVGEATYQVPSRSLRVRVGLGAVGEEGAESVARGILTAVFGAEEDWKRSSYDALALPSTAELKVIGNDVFLDGVRVGSLDDLTATMDPSASAGPAPAYDDSATGSAPPPADRMSSLGAAMVRNHAIQCLGDWGCQTVDLDSDIMWKATSVPHDPGMESRLRLEDPYGD